MDIENVNIAGPQVLETSFNTKVKTLDIVSKVGNFLGDGRVQGLEVVRVLRG